MDMPFGGRAREEENEIEGREWERGGGGGREWERRREREGVEKSRERGAGKRKKREKEGNTEKYRKDLQERAGGLRGTFPLFPVDH